ncbi:MAG TPA: response regulator transcription factor [Vicinamibacterales bacterium]
MRANVLLADDHQIVRQGVRALLERERFDVVAEASDGQEAVRLAEATRPDIAVLDLSMPTLNGIDAGREILKVSPRTRFLLLTMHTEEHHILEALRAGARGCVTKSQASEHLVQAIREVCADRVYLSPSVSGAVVQAYLAGTALPYEPLTARERQVLQLVAEGKTTKEVAVILGISVKTAESHRTRIMEKLDIHSTAGLVHYAIRRGLVAA